MFEYKLITNNYECINFAELSVRKMFYSTTVNYARKMVIESVTG
jgi:hypothetical protein